jgi:prevent-host-death family protein
MSEYSVADAKNNLPKLINRALEGEAVVITRHGQPVIELRPVAPTERTTTKATLDRLAKFRADLAKTMRPASERPTSVDIVRQMRDEGA